MVTGAGQLDETWLKAAVQYLGQKVFTELVETTFSIPEYFVFDFFNL